MPTAFKPVVVRNISVAATTIYTCPAATQAIVFSLVLSNTGTNPVGVDIWTVIAGNVTYLGRFLPIPSGGSLVMPKCALNAGDSIRAQSTGAPTIDATASVIEIT